MVSVSGVPAREDAVPSNLQYQSKLGTRERSQLFILFSYDSFVEESRVVR
ncbi:MAG: hypothetical protein [Olavius algarvensis Gamma 1 endosymbiont]|nr:MAG: hypothetical protein [Olavius algarvensis Gamma 1 endosymbiont]